MRAPPTDYSLAQDGSHQGVELALVVVGACGSVRCAMAGLHQEPHQRASVQPDLPQVELPRPHPFLELFQQQGLEAKCRFVDALFTRS